jgi:hypothetical protein
MLPVTMPTADVEKAQRERAEQRERVALEALRGLLLAEVGLKGGIFVPEMIADMAVQLADALIRRLWQP